jgi:hypothetical protein
MAVLAAFLRDETDQELINLAGNSEQIFLPKQKTDGMPHRFPKN